MCLKYILRYDTDSLTGRDRDQRSQTFGKLEIIAFQLFLVVLLVRLDKILVFLQGVMAPRACVVSDMIFQQQFKNKVYFLEKSLKHNRNLF